MCDLNIEACSGLGCYAQPIPFERHVYSRAGYRVYLACFAYGVVNSVTSVHQYGQQLLHRRDLPT